MKKEEDWNRHRLLMSRNLYMRILKKGEGEHYPQVKEGARQGTGVVGSNQRDGEQTEEEKRRKKGRSSNKIR